MPHFKRENRELYYTDEGSQNGHPVVFIHGFLGDSKSHWGNQLNNPNMLTNFKLIAPDLRGFGKSGDTRWGESFPTTTLLEDVRFLIKDHLKLNDNIIH